MWFVLRCGCGRGEQAKQRRGEAWLAMSAAERRDAVAQERTIMEAAGGGSSS